MIKPSNRASIRNISDYSPFGVQLSERTISGDGYRYGFQGYEGDSEVKGSGNSYSTEFRQYDPRIGRWLSQDPLADKFPWQSPYCSMDNNPIFYIDPLGLESEDPTDPPKNDETVLAGQQKSNGEFNGSQEIEEVSVAYNRSTKSIDTSPPPSPAKGGSWKVEVSINGTSINKSGLTFRQARDFQTSFNDKLDELRRLEQQRKDANWSFLDPLDWPGQHVDYPQLLPDAISIDVAVSGKAGTGTDHTVSFNWILSGKNASYKPVITLTTCVGVGYDVSGSAGLSLHYKGQGDLLRTDFETTRGKYFIDQGLKTSIGGSIFGKASLSHTYAPLGPNNYMNSYGLGLGLSVTPVLNGGTGVPTTIILYGRD